MIWRANIVEKNRGLVEFKGRASMSDQEVRERAVIEANKGNAVYHDTDIEVGEVTAE